MNRLRIGARCEIKPAFDADTGARTHFDEITHFEVWVTAILTGGDVEVTTRMGREYIVNVGRLRFL